MFHLGKAILTGMKHSGINMYKIVRLDMNLKSGTLSGLVSGKQGASLHTVNRFAEYFKVPLSTFILWGESHVDLYELEEEVIKWQRSADRKLNGNHTQRMAMR